MFDFLYQSCVHFVRHAVGLRELLCREQQLTVQQEVALFFSSGVLELYDEIYREQQNHVFTLGWVIYDRCHCE